MPYKSDAQRRFFHTDTAKKAGITDKEVNEFDKASKGMALPEKVKKHADGGKIQDEPGVQDATVSDFLAPLIGGSLVGKAAEGVGPALEGLEGLGEAGELTLGKAAPEMEGMAPKVEVYVKGIQKGGSEPIKIYGVKGDPDEIAKLGFGKDPGSIPEHVLKQHGLLPETSVDASNLPSPNAYADGGVVDSIKHYFGADKSDAQTADNIDPVVTSSSSTVTNKAKGGAITRYNKGGTAEPDYKEKLAIILKHMKQNPIPKMAEGGTMSEIEPYSTQSEGDLGLPQAILGALKDVAGPTTDVGDLVAARLSGSPTTAPQINQQNAEALRTPPPAPIPPSPQTVPQTQPQSPTPINPQNINPPEQPMAMPKEKPAANDILTKLIDGDSAKMQALLSELKDSDKRSAFAQALGVIGDTFGNIGMAKAGQRPEGFTSPQMLAGMNEQQKQSKIDLLNKQLAADPNSQSSKAAQMVLMQSMGISPNDPRAANIQKMPAQAITQFIPQMTDAVKNNIEKERNLITSKEDDYTHQIAEITKQIAAGQLTRENKVAAISALNDVAKNAPFYRPDMKNQALQMAQQLSKDLSGPQQGIVSQHPNGSVIRKVQ